jgi:hypothetical protein
MERAEVSSVNWQALLCDLSVPFPESVVQWRAGATSKDKKRAQALPYAEARVYEDRLNSLCPGCWQVDFTPWSESRIICRLTIHDVTRASTGEAGDSQQSVAGTSAEAQAFKRACSRFGLGRYLYDLPSTWVAYDAEKRVLLETPKLPSTVAATNQTHETNGGRLTRQRAQKLHTLLKEAGLGREGHYALAAEVVGREVQSLTELDESQGLELLRLSRLEASKVLAR